MKFLSLVFQHSGRDVTVDIVGIKALSERMNCIADVLVDSVFNKCTQLNKDKLPIVFFRVSFEWW